MHLSGAQDASLNQPDSLIHCTELNLDSLYFDSLYLDSLCLDSLHLDPLYLDSLTSTHSTSTHSTLGFKIYPRLTLFLDFTLYLEVCYSTVCLDLSYTLPETQPLEINSTAVTLDVRSSHKLNLFSLLRPFSGPLRLTSFAPRLLHITRRVP